MGNGPFNSLLQAKVSGAPLTLPLPNPILSFVRSNCDSEVRQELRRHYSKPYFIPSDSEHSETDWIFMGGVGPGANIHVSVNIALGGMILSSNS